MARQSKLEETSKWCRLVEEYILEKRPQDNLDFWYTRGYWHGLVGHRMKPNFSGKNSYEMGIADALGDWPND